MLAKFGRVWPLRRRSCRTVCRSRGKKRWKSCRRCSTLRSGLGGIRMYKLETLPQTRDTCTLYVFHFSLAFELLSIRCRTFRSSVKWQAAHKLFTFQPTGNREHENVRLQDVREAQREVVIRREEGEVDEVERVARPGRHFGGGRRKVEEMTRKCHFDKSGAFEVRRS
jgi:hypothetical protein